MQTEFLCRWIPLTNRLGDLKNTSSEATRGSTLNHMKWSPRRSRCPSWIVTISCYPERFCIASLRILYLLPLLEILCEMSHMQGFIFDMNSVGCNLTSWFPLGHLFFRLRACLPALPTWYHAYIPPSSAFNLWFPKPPGHCHRVPLRPAFPQGSRCGDANCLGAKLEGSSVSYLTSLPETDI